MDVLLRYTVIGAGIHRLFPSYLMHEDERDPSHVKKLVSIQDSSESLPEALDENTSLLANGDAPNDHNILLVEWYGSDDPENPLNWPLLTKAVTVAVVSILTVVLYAGSSFWSTSVDDIVATFRVSETVANLGTSLFVLGMGLGPMIFSPLSEVPSVGRLRVYFWTTLAYILCQLPIPLCNNIWAMLVLRFFTGALCSPVLAVGGGTVTDMFVPSTRGYPMSVWEMATWGGSACGPALAGFTAQRYGYKGPMWELVIMAGIGLLLTIFVLPETLPTAILHQRAQRLRRANKGTKFVTHSELEEFKTSFRAVVGGLFVKSITLNFQEPIVFILNLYVALIFAIFFGMLESYPFVLKQPPHNFNTGEVGLSFLGIFVGGIFTMFLYLLFLKYYQSKHFDKEGNIRPELRLWPAIPGSIFIPLGLFWYGWTTQLHWIMPVLGGVFFGIGVFTTFMVMLTYLPDAYPSVAATVIAGNCLMRAVLGFAFPLFTTQYYEALGPGIATSILGAIGVLFVPWPVVLFYRGRNIRMRSKNARKDI